MADPVVSPIVKRNYGSRLTLDVDSSYPENSPESCDTLKNLIRRKGRSFSKRPGAKLVYSSELSSTWDSIWLGLHKYLYTNSDSGITEELLAITPFGVFKKHPRSQGFIGLNYVGAGTASFSLLANASLVWEATLKVDGVVLPGWPKSYGDGLDAASGTITDLLLDIDAETDWSYGYLGGYVPLVSLAHVGTVPETNLVPASSPDLKIYVETLNSLEFSLFYGSLNAGELGTDVVNLKGENAANCMFFPTGKRDSILKYDGRVTCKPGLPRATITSIADTGAGTTHASGNTYIYRICFWKVDNRENQIYGPYSDDTLAVATHTVGGAPSDITISFAPLRDDVTPDVYYKAKSATVNGTQAGVVAVVVDAGHGLVTGDVIYFKNRLTGAYVTKTLTATSATSVTFVGAVNVTDNDVMGTHRVQIQRTENDGIDFFEVDNIPNDANLAGSAQTYRDSISDTSLGSAIEDQIKLPEEPPYAAFACVHQGLLVLANLLDDPTGFTWNDPEWGFEAFPSATNRDQIIGSGGGEITAIISESDTALAIFKKGAYFRIEGDLASGQYTINEVSAEGLGVASHASLVKTELGIFGISDRGPVVIKDGKISLDASVGVQSFFKENDYVVEVGDTISNEDYTKLVPKRSTGVFWKDKNCLLFFVPAESGEYVATGGGLAIPRYANEASLWLCYDLLTKEWRDWSFDDYNINAHLGMVEVNGEVYFISTNEWDGGALTYVSPNFVWKFLKGDSTYHYADNSRPISFAPRLAFEPVGSPDSEKNMDALKVLATNDADFIDDFTLEVNEYRNQDSSVLSRYLHATRTFDGTAASREKIIDPVPGDFLCNSIELKNEELYECPVISGIAVSYKVTTSAEMKDQKGSG